MKSIERAKLEANPTLTRDIRDFWTTNVNAERIMGKSVSQFERGDDEYFAELERQRYRSHRHLLPWIRSMQPGKSTLEIGCGVGLDSHTLATHGLRLTAVDLTQVGVKTAKDRFDRGRLDAGFSVADACNLPFADDTFDYVYSFGVLHHTADTEKSIREVHRILKAGGEARIMLYHRHSLNELVHRITRVPFEERDKLCPVVRRFTRREVRAMCRSFREVRIHADFVYGEGYGLVFRMTPRWLYSMLSRRVGWHLMIEAVK